MTTDLFQSWEAFAAALTLISLFGARAVDVAAGLLADYTGRAWTSGPGKLQISNIMSAAMTVLVFVFAAVEGDFTLIASSTGLATLAMTAFSVYLAMRAGFEASYKSSKGNLVLKQGMNPDAVAE